MPLPHRLRSFSLRTLMVLVAVACVVAALVARERNLAADRRQAAIRLQYAGAVVESTVTGPPLLRRMLSESWFEHVHGVAARGPQFNNETLADLSLLRDLQDLEINSFEVGDGAVAHLRCLPEIRSLDVSRTAITARGLNGLGVLRQLQSVTINADQLDSQTIAWLASRRISNLGIRGAVSASQVSALCQLAELRGLALFDARDSIAFELKELNQITLLQLESDQLTDAALMVLEQGLASLQHLLLLDTSATECGVERLERLRSKLDVQVYLSTPHRRQQWNRPASRPASDSTP